MIKQTEAKQLKIDKVLLIGGSSQLTLVRQMLFEVLPETTIDTCGEKDIAVALGNVADEQIIIKESEKKSPMMMKTMRLAKSHQWFIIMKTMES